METNAIIDTACSKTVSDEKWFSNFIKSSDDTALNKVHIIPSKIWWWSKSLFKI